MALSVGFGVDSLTFIEREDFVPGPGQVVVRMLAVSLNYRDLLVVDGISRWRPSLPRVPVSDGVGVVVAAGAGVSRLRVGDRVMPIFYPHWMDGSVSPDKLARPLGGAVADGVLAEAALFDESAVVSVPEYLSREAAATLPCAAVTAWNAVMVASNITPGDTVVVLGTGGVSLFAIQFARLKGARVIATSSSNDKLERVSELGTDAGVNYRLNPDWPSAVRDLTDGAGADHVIDVAGDLSRAIEAVRYHELDLLPPAAIDPTSGYRLYDAAQAPTAQVIRRFRDLGMPLEELRVLVKAPDVQTRNAAIIAHLRRMEQQLAGTQAAVASLRNLIENPPAPIAMEFRAVGAFHASEARRHCAG